MHRCAVTVEQREQSLWRRKYLLWLAVTIYIYILPDPENPSSPRLRIYRSYVEAIILAILAIRDRALFGTHLPATIVYLPIFTS